MFILTLLAVSWLCLAFNSTRLFGIISLALLYYLFPPLLTITLASGAIIGGFYFTLRKKP